MTPKTILGMRKIGNYAELSTRLERSTDGSRTASTLQTKIMEVLQHFGKSDSTPFRLFVSGAYAHQVF